MVSPSLYNFIKGDICNYSRLSKSIREFQPDYIVNFAAESHVDRSIDGPKEFINTNILGTYTILDVALKYWDNLPKKKMYLSSQTFLPLIVISI